MFTETEFGVDGVDYKTNAEIYYELVDGNRTIIDEKRFDFLMDLFRTN